MSCSVPFAMMFVVTEGKTAAIGPGGKSAAGNIVSGVYGGDLRSEIEHAVNAIGDEEIVVLIDERRARRDGRLRSVGGIVQVGNISTEGK